MKNKKGQEEIVGFALIIILVAVIFLVFFAYSIRKSVSEDVDSPELTSFMQSILQYTTECKQNSKNITVSELIFKCQEKEYCSPNLNPCKVLENTLKEIIDVSWNVEKGSPNKGYSFIISSRENQIININKGVVTNNYKGSEQDFAKGKEFVSVFFKVYS